MKQLEISAGRAEVVVFDESMEGVIARIRVNGWDRLREGILRVCIRARLPGDSRTVWVSEWGYRANLANPDGVLELRALPPGGQLGISARGSKSEGDDWTLELPATPGDAIDFEIDVP